MKRILWIFFFIWLNGNLVAQSLFLAMDEVHARRYVSENVDAPIHMVKEIRVLSTDISKQIEESVGRVCGDTLYFFRVDGTDASCVAIFGQAPSKHSQFDFLVLLDAQTGVVQKVDVTVYRENQGNQIDYERFKKQFVGKKKPSDFRFKRKIRSITGATISARSMALAVRKTVQVYAILLKSGANHD